MLVSAVETAGNHWRKGTDTPLKRLKAAKPELAELLQSTGIEKLTEQVANHIADTMKSTKKFLDFMSTFMPPPPGRRPGEWAQHPWESGSLKKTMRLIYSYRSMALHDGRPFPASMCEPPFRLQDWNAPTEKPVGLASSMLGRTWLAKDTPMLLQTFEYIVRNALLAWWKSMASSVAC
jgi:hypothetical protein